MSSYLCYTFYGNEHKYSKIIKDTPCHHGIGRLQAAGGGDGHKIWRIAASVLNK